MLMILWFRVEFGCNLEKLFNNKSGLAQFDGNQEEEKIRKQRHEHPLPGLFCR
jgi:hypothetical protein